jgi:alpha-glucuronidase
MTDWEDKQMNKSQIKMTLQVSKHRSINFWDVIETPKWQIEKMNIWTNLDGQIHLHSMHPNIHFREFV